MSKKKRLRRNLHTEQKSIILTQEMDAQGMMHCNFWTPGIIQDNNQMELYTLTWGRTFDHSRMHDIQSIGNISKTAYLKQTRKNQLLDGSHKYSELYAMKRSFQFIWS